MILVIFSEVTRRKCVRDGYTAVDSENVSCAAMSAIAELLFLFKKIIYRVGQKLNL